MTVAVTDYRREPFAELARREGVEVVAFGGPGAAPDPPVAGLAVRSTSQVGAVRLAGSGRYRAVIAGLGGRVALPGAYAGARRAGVPFVLWASLWAHPRSAAHALSYLPTRHLYRHADAVATYGPHVSAYVAGVRGGRHGVFEAPQAVSLRHFGARVSAERRAEARARAGASEGDCLVLFVGRLVPEKGVDVLLEAWREAGAEAGAALAVAGSGRLAGRVQAAGECVTALGHVDREELPALYAAADLLVVPSVSTATFREPWGLVANEAMLQKTPIIASDAVGAVAGGLVVDGRNGLVVPAGQAAALARALRTLIGDPERRQALGDAARRDASQLSPAAWAAGMSRALAAVGRSRGGVPC